MGGRSADVVCWDGKGKKKRKKKNKKKNKKGFLEKEPKNIMIVVLYLQKEQKIL